MPNFQNDPDYEECIVSFLDVLGFRNLINELSADELRQKLTTFQHFTKPDVSETASKDYGRGVFSDPGYEIISDAVVRARPIRTEVRDGPLVSELIDLLHIQIECIGHGIILRGAVVVDFLHLGERLVGPFFGPALIGAYEMEKDEVIFPRICIMESAIDLLKNDESLRKDYHTLQDEMEVIEDFVKTDESGLYYIDYLKGALYEFESDYAIFCIFLERDKDVIETGISRASLPKHLRKYAWLKNYHNTRIDELMENIDPIAFINEYECSIEGAFSPLRIE